MGPVVEHDPLGDADGAARYGRRAQALVREEGRQQMRVRAQKRQVHAAILPSRR
ncbi:hypothetical protein [Nocardia sp. MW-W600-9]